MLMGPCAVTEASPQACASPRGNHEFSIIERLLMESGSLASGLVNEARHLFGSRQQVLARYGHTR